MTDRPILFSTPMVRALLAGTKTQTRRILKHQPPELSRFAGFYSVPLSGAFQCKLQGEKNLLTQRVPYSVGDRLWVRETWQGLSFGDYLPTKSCQCEVRYAATDPCADLDAEARGYPWRPSIFMPRFASRLTLTVTDVRVERLQDISGSDAIAEGADITGEQTMTGPMVKVAPGTYLSPVAWYHRLWDSINGAGSWDANPWVVAYTFTVQNSNIDQLATVAA
jgi:hypothetical protein